MVCGAWFAIDRAWMPSCCLTCSDWSAALSFAMLASTSWPIPAVSVSDSFWLKPAWIENFFTPDESLASAAFTLVSEDWSVATSVDAFCDTHGFGSALRRQAEGHDVSVMSRSKRIRTPDEKLAGFRARAERAMAMSKS